MARVLLVDDDVGVLETCGAFLRLAGLNVETVASGRGALDTLDRDPPDLLFLDLNLPDMAGLEVLAEVRRRGSRVPAIVITGHPGLESSVRAVRLGVADYLIKPVDGDALVAAAVIALSLGVRESVPSMAAGTRSAEATVPDARAVPEDAHAVADALALWATAMCRLVNAPRDVATVGRWAVLLEISESTLRRWCHVAGVDARASLVLARVLRAVRCAREHGSLPDRFLAVSDPHTAKRMLLEAGVDPGAVPTVQETLARQTLVADRLALRALHARLAARPTSRSG